MNTKVYQKLILQSKQNSNKSIKRKYYYKRLGDFRRELRDTLSTPVLRELHKAVYWKHFAILFRQIMLAVAAIYLALHYNAVWIWLPCSVVLGTIIFDFTILLHEVIHNAVFEKKHPRLNSVLGWLYALPSGISRTQFTRWHLDHHNELGHELTDPKRAHLTPKTVKRWYKMLYMTPALFPIYFHAAAKEAESYPFKIQQKIKNERWITIGVHLSVMAGLIFSIWMVGFR